MMAAFSDASSSCISWSPDLEVSLFHSMKGHKPVGVNRFFHMACIHDKFSTTSGRKDITSRQLWEHLEQMYNLDALNEIESLPFPNDETEFSLPEELTNPEQSQPPSPATSVEETSAVQRPTNLKLTTIQSALSGSSPDASVSSPKRKRTRGPLATSSQPSSPAPVGTGSKGRRR